MAVWFSTEKMGFVADAPRELLEFCRDAGLLKGGALAQVVATHPNQDHARPQDEASETVREVAELTRIAASPRSSNRESVPTVEQLVQVWDDLGSESMREAFRIMATQPRGLKTKDVADKIGVSSLGGVLGGFSKAAYKAGFTLQKWYSARRGVFIFNSQFHANMAEALRTVEGEPQQGASGDSFRFNA